MESMKSFPAFGKKIEMPFLRDSVRDLLSSGFQDISLLHIQEQAIDYYFTNSFFEKEYRENNFVHQDSRIKALLTSKAGLIPWTTLPQRDQVLACHKKTAGINSGLSLLESLDSKNKVILHLGFLEETREIDFLSCSTSLQYLFLMMKHIARNLIQKT